MSLDVKMIEIVMIVVVLISRFAVSLLQHLTNANAFRARIEGSSLDQTFGGEYPSDGYSARDGYLTGVWTILCVHLFATIVVYALGERHFTALYEMRNTISNYDVNDAQLSVDADRDFLLNIVDDLFSDAPVEKVKVDDPPPGRRDLADGEVVEADGVEGDVWDDDAQEPLEVEAVEVVDASEPLVHAGVDGDGDPDVQSPARQSIAADGQLLLDDHTTEGHVQDGHATQGTPRAGSTSEAPHACCSRGTTSEAAPAPHSSGILAFNHAVQTLVPQQLPLSGMRSWKLFGYLTAALVFGTIELMSFLDTWAWAVVENSNVAARHGYYDNYENAEPIVEARLLQPAGGSPPDGPAGGSPPDDPAGGGGPPGDNDPKLLNLADYAIGDDILGMVGDDIPDMGPADIDSASSNNIALPHSIWAERYKNFRSVIGLVWLVLILMPFSAYLLGAQVKFFLSFHNWSGWPRWASFVVFLPILLVVECILCWRLLLIDNLKQVLVYGTIVHAPDTVQDWQRVDYKLIYAPIYGPLQAVLYCSYNLDDPIPGSITGWWIFLGQNGVDQKNMQIFIEKICRVNVHC